MYRVTIRCTENKDHAKILQMNLPLAMVEDFAGLMDGTSPMFIYPPGPGSPIGKCGICRGQLMSTIEEWKDGDQADIKVDRECNGVVLREQLKGSVDAESQE